MSLVLPIEIVADSAAVDSSVPLYLNKQKHLDRYVFRQSVKDECQVAYVGYPALIYQNTVAVNNQANEIAENRKRIADDTWVKTGSTFTSSNPDILVTTETIVERGVVTPLFYGMELPRNTVSATASSYIKDDQAFQYKYNNDSKVIYVNKKSYWDPALKDYRAVNVKYRLDTGEEHTAILRNSPVYRVADVSDIDPMTLTFYAESPVYTRTVNGSGYEYEFNGTGPFYVKEPEGSRISLSRSNAQKLSEPWLLDVSAGNFQRINDGTTYSYSVAEYEDQVFYPFYPYARYTHRPLLLDARTLKLPEANLVVKPDVGIHAEVVVRDENGKVKKAYTTATSKVGDTYIYWEWESREVRWEELSLSFDQENSVIVLNNTVPLLSSDQISVNYSVVKNTFTYRGLNLNPNFNKRLAAYEYMLYIVPSTLVEDGKSIFHVEYDYLPDGTTRITDITQPSEAGFVGGTLESFISSRFATAPTSNTYQYVTLGFVSLRPEFSVEDILSRDARLKMGIDRRKQLDVLERHPWAWWSKLFSDRDIEFPDKFFSCVEYDHANILATEADEIKSLLEVHKAAGTNLVIKQGGVYPRVKDMQCRTDEVLTISLMPEATGTTFYLMRMRNGGIVPDRFLDSNLVTFTLTYGNAIVEEVVALNSLLAPEDVHKLYIVAEPPNGVLSGPSEVFEVRIRNV